VPRRCGGSGEAGRRRALAAPSRPPRHPLCGIYWFFFFCVSYVFVCGWYIYVSVSVSIFCDCSHVYASPPAPASVCASVYAHTVSVSIFCDCSHVYASPPAPASVCASVYAHTSVYVCELVMIRYGKASPGADFLPPTHTYTLPGLCFLAFSPHLALPSLNLIPLEQAVSTFRGSLRETCKGEVFWRGLRSL
jgi:hypothetical protein